MNEIKSWDWFKDLVKRLRNQQNELMQEQGGGNQVMVSLSLVAYNVGDWIHLNPHSINLHSGKTLAEVNGTYMTIDVKYLFLMQRLKEIEAKKEGSE